VKPDSSQPIVNLTRANVICERAVIADRPLRRMHGLLGRRSLPAGQALLLQPAPSVHTAFMRFAIDVVFLDRDLRVVKLVENLRPWRTAAARHARSALELAAGEVAARSIQVGDQLALVTVTDHSRVDEPRANSTKKSTPILARGTREARLGGHEPLKVTARRADPIHVLLIGKDRRFRSVAAALLAQRGCTVTVAERMADASRVAKRGTADVVVIDASSSASEAAYEATRVQIVDRTVGVLLVGEQREERPLSIPILPKWGSFDELYGAIESVRSNTNRRSINGQR
jgi:uncharacterized membrane protein (UPF0127 family)